MFVVLQRISAIQITTTFSWSGQFMMSMMRKLRMDLQIQVDLMLARDGVLKHWRRVQRMLSPTDYCILIFSKFAIVDW